MVVNRKGLHSRLCKFWPPSLVLKLTSSGPTVEKGLAALDSLYDLRNVIPGLISSSKMEDQEGELPQARATDLAYVQPGIHSGCLLYWHYQSSVSMPTPQSANAQSPTSSVSSSPRICRYLNRHNRFSTESCSLSWTNCSSRPIQHWQKQDYEQLDCCARCFWRMLLDSQRVPMGSYRYLRGC